MRRVFLCLFTAGVFVSSACGDIDKKLTSDGDADADGDGDSDGDSDTDTGTDADTDTDSDTDADTDTDTDTDSDGDTDSDTDADTDSDSDTGCEMFFSLQQKLELTGTFQGVLLSPGDADGDGDLDLYGWADYGGGYYDILTWAENTAGDWSSWHGTSFTSGYTPNTMIAGDVDGDGRAELITSEQGSWENVAVWDDVLDGSDFNYISASLAADELAVADVDGDGDLDVMAALYTEAWIGWWENATGDGSSWTPHLVDSSCSWSNDVAVRDVDGDGDLDVVGECYNSTASATELFWWENADGLGDTWTEHMIESYDVSLFADDLLAEDIDGDGDADVVEKFVGSGDDLVWWENLAGDGTSWEEHVLGSSSSPEGNLAAGDLDLDGDLDVISTASDDGEVTVWRNENGDGSVWAPLMLDYYFFDVDRVFVMDADCDGDFDVVANSGNVGWWENLCGAPVVDPGCGGMYDPATALCWQIEADETGKTASEALDYCDGLTLEGFNDWRLPSIDEARSLIQGCPITGFGGSCDLDEDCTSSGCDSTSCNGCSAGDGPAAGGCYWDAALSGSCDEMAYWTSNSLEGNSMYHWNVDYIDGSLDDPFIDTILAVRCVRSTY